MKTINTQWLQNFGGGGISQYSVYSSRNDGCLAHNEYRFGLYAVINAIKELDAKYQAQEKRIENLEKRIQVLESKIK